jgi:hypothetical protein
MTDHSPGGPLAAGPVSKASPLWDWAKLLLAVLVILNLI